MNVVSYGAAQPTRFAPPTPLPSATDKLAGLGHALSAIEEPDIQQQSVDDARRAHLLSTALGLVSQQNQQSQVQGQQDIEKQRLAADTVYRQGLLGGEAESRATTAAHMGAEDRLGQGKLAEDTRHAKSTEAQSAQALSEGKGLKDVSFADTLARGGSPEEALQVMAGYNPQVYGPIVKAHQDKQLADATNALEPLAIAAQKKGNSPELVNPLKETAGHLPRGQEALQVLMQKYGLDKAPVISGKLPTRMQEFINDPEIGPILKGQQEDSAKDQAATDKEMLQRRRNQALIELMGVSTPHAY